MKKNARIIPYLFVFGLLIFSNATVFGQTEDEALEEIVAYGNAGKYKKALKLCDELIAKNPKSILAYQNKCTIYKNLGDYSQAFDALNQGLTANPNSAELYHERGIFYQNAAKTDAAIRDYNLGIKFAENDTLRNSIMISKATAYSDLRNFKEAYTIDMECFAFDSMNLVLLNNLAIICDEIGKSDLTIYYLTKVVEADSLFTPGYVNIGFYYQGKGEYEKSIPYFDKALLLDPNEALSYSNRSYSKLKIGDLEGALKDVNRSLELYSTNSYAYRNRALIYLEMGQKTKACEDLQRAIDLGFTTQYGNEVRDLIGRNC